jgi:hypothetical protein
MLRKKRNFDWIVEFKFLDINMDKNLGLKKTYQIA